MEKVLITIGIAFFLIIALIGSCEDNYKTEEELAAEIVREDTLCGEFLMDYDTLNSIGRTWVDYDNQQFCTTYLSYDTLVKQSSAFRKSYADDSTQDFYAAWGQLYEHMYNHDKTYFPRLIDSLKAIQERYQLDRDEFANVVVSFVQDIPYTYILDYTESCNTISDGTPCVDNIRFGILTPYEFLHTLYGDCDTRTVLLYTILKHFDYEPKVVISYNYEHSMLLLDVAAAGSYFYQQGKNYYFWETTGTGWKPGIIPPGMGDLYWWNIVLN